MMLVFKAMLIACVLFLAGPNSGTDSSTLNKTHHTANLRNTPEAGEQNSGSKTFIFNVSINDLNEFKKFVAIAARLKKYGEVQVSISKPADKAFYEIPAGGNPWSEYASYNATLYKFYPDPKIAPFVPVDYVKKNQELIVAKAKILREYGLYAAFFANEPGFLPATFFDQYPKLRGPRVDHPRRSNYAFFSPCLSVKESRDMYTYMAGELIRNVPEIKSFYFKTNDAGSGNCWTDWLYNGPNGPSHCRNQTTGMRIHDLMSSIVNGATKTGKKLDVYLSFPQGSSNLSDEEREDIQNRLPDNCYFKSTDAHEMKSIGSDVSSLYPVTGIADVLSFIKDFSRIDKQKKQTVFINFRVSYDRGNENIVVEEIFIDLLCDYLSGEELPTLDRLQKYCNHWGGEKNADKLYRSFIDLADAFNYKYSNLGNLSGINWNMTARMINHPLVAVPQLLTKKEEAYFLPYIFNVSYEEARMDYMDIQGGRWETKPDSVKVYLGKIAGICAKLKTVDASAPKYTYIKQLEKALQIHASLIRSCGNFAAAQAIRDANADKLNAPAHRPDKNATWTGDTALLKFNSIMRDELDNTEDLISILETGGIDLICKAKDAAHEDNFLLGPNLVTQLKQKRKIMLNHWRDIENYMTSPFK